MRILVTGGAGFIGSHTVERLLREGHSVRVLDNLSTGRRDNLAAVAGEVELLEGDVRDLAMVRRAMAGADAVLHLAALGAVARSVADPLATHAVNATGTLHVLVAAREAHVRRVVFASSSSVYGDTPELPKHEEMTPSPLSPYAVTKVNGEHYCAVFHRLYGLETVALRYFNVFGPRQDPTSRYSAVVPRFIQALLEGQAPTIYGDGQQSRDFTYIANVVEANVLALRAAPGLGGAYNVACGQRVTVGHLARTLAGLLGSQVAPVHAPPREGDVRHSLADLRRVQEALGYQPLVSFEEGLARTVAWARSAAGEGAWSVR